MSQITQKSKFLRIFTQSSQLRSTLEGEYSGGGVRNPPPEYCVMMRNFGRFLRKVWISNLLRNINFYAIKITRLRNLLRKCFGQAASSPASWFAPCCCAMGMLNFFCLSPDPAPLENIWWQFRISSQAVPS